MSGASNCKTSAMAKIDYECQRCGSQGLAECYETTIDRRLRWSCSFRCRICDAAVEEDGIGFPPTHVRQAILRDGGRWNVVLTSPSATARVLLILRTLVPSTLKELMVALQPSPRMRFFQVPRPRLIGSLQPSMMSWSMRSRCWLKSTINSRRPHARMSRITCPPTSVRLSSRPWWKYVSSSWSSPINCRIVA